MHFESKLVMKINKCKETTKNVLNMLFWKVYDNTILFTFQSGIEGKMKQADDWLLDPRAVLGGVGMSRTQLNQRCHFALVFL